MGLLSFSILMNKADEQEDTCHLAVEMSCPPEAQLSRAELSAQPFNTPEHTVHMCELLFTYNLAKWTPSECRHQSFNREDLKHELQSALLKDVEPGFGFTETNH